MTEDDLKDDKNFEAATLGIETEAWVRTKPGKFLWDKAVGEEEQSFEDFLKADPTDTSEMIRIQQQARIARMFREWVSEAIAVGKHAEEQIRTNEEII